MNIIEEVNTGDIRLCTIYLNSIEDKPIEGISGGSICYETNTCKKFIFDELTRQWNEIHCPYCLEQIESEL